MLTERKLRQIIRKMIMEGINDTIKQATADATEIRNQIRNKSIAEKDKIGNFKKTLGNNDKEFNDKIKQLGEYFGIVFNPVKDPQIINTVLEKALAELK
jgi:hypothetical protein